MATNDHNLDSDPKQQPHLRPWRSIYFDEGEVAFNWRYTNTFRMGYRWRDVTPSSKARVRRMMAAMSRVGDVPMWEHKPLYHKGARVNVLPQSLDSFPWPIPGVVVDYNVVFCERRYDYIIEIKNGFAYRDESRLVGIIDDDEDEGGAE